jgi:hypothetical protein
MKYIKTLNEYAYEDNKHGDIEYYYLPFFMWSDVKHGYTESERANWFVQYDGIADARVMENDVLRLSAQYDGIMEVIKDVLDVMNDEYIFGELTKYMGKKPETEEEVIEYLKTNEP